MQVCWLLAVHDEHDQNILTLIEVCGCPSVSLCTVLASVGETAGRLIAVNKIIPPEVHITITFPHLLTSDLQFRKIGLCMARQQQ